MEPPAVECPLPGQVNYFLGRDPAGWRTRLPRFAALRYREVQPGVDLVFHPGDAGAFEFDIEVAPGASAEDLRFSLTGSRRLRLDARGDLRAAAGAGEIVLRRPRLFQRTPGAVRELAGELVLAGPAELAIAAEAWDPGQALTIDPVLLYSSYLGGSQDDVVMGLATDLDGYLYLTGRTASAGRPRSATTSSRSRRRRSSRSSSRGGTSPQRLPTISTRTW